MKYAKLSLLIVIGTSLFFLRNIKPQEAKTTTPEQKQRRDYNFRYKTNNKSFFKSKTSQNIC